MTKKIQVSLVGSYTPKLEHYPGCKTIEDMLHDLGIKKTHLVDKTQSKLSTIETSQNFLKTCWIDSVNCGKGIEALENYKKRQAPNGRFLESPYHDDKGYCDAADARRVCDGEPIA